MKSLCHEWDGHIQANGYGKAYNPRTQKIDMAHRVAWEKANGRPVPAGMVVMHSCANRGCVNPEHLELGTQHENRMEMVQRSVNPKQKLTWEEAELIRWCRRQGPRVGNYGWNKRVAKACNVSQYAIGSLLRGETFTEAH